MRKRYSTGRILSTLGLSLALLWPAAVSAQAASESDRDRALELFEQSVEHYRAGRFDVAAALLREAYDLHAEPTLLYNLARALDGSGDTAGAIDAYERFLEAAPDTPDRGAVERTLVTLRQRLELAQDRDGGDGIDGDVTGPAPVDRPGNDGRSVSPLPWIVLGVGVAAVATGAVVGLMAGSRHDDAVAAPIQRDAADLADQADSLALVANIAFIAGGVIAAAGLAWAIVDLTGSGDDEADDSARLLIGPGTLTIAGRWR